MWHRLSRMCPGNSTGVSRGANKRPSVYLCAVSLRKIIPATSLLRPVTDLVLQPEAGLLQTLSLRLGRWCLDSMTWRQLVRNLCAERGMGLQTILQVKGTSCCWFAFSVVDEKKITSKTLKVP